jgi:hypothetical protein
VEAVAFDDGGVDVFAAEDVLEGARHRGGARADEPVMAMMGWRSDMVGLLG